QVVGTVTGRRVQLAGTAHVMGDIRHQSLGMEMGARLDGCCRHSADPLALAAPAAAPAVSAPVIPVAPVAIAVAPAPPAPPPPAQAPEGVSLARAAMRSEERSAPTESVTHEAPSRLAVAAAAAQPEPALEPVAQVASELAALKSAGLKLRARVPKTPGVSGRK